MPLTFFSGGVVGLGFFFFFISGKELVKYRAHMEMADVVGFLIFFVVLVSKIMHTGVCEILQRI